MPVDSSPERLTHQRRQQHPKAGEVGLKTGGAVESLLSC